MWAGTEADATKASWLAAAAALHSAPQDLEPCALRPREECELRPDGGGCIILLRHGESVWNRANRFTGWEDVPLSPLGEEQAVRAAGLLEDAGLAGCIDRVFTSSLKRTIKTSWLVQESLDLFNVAVTSDWRLNERMYGALTGLNKDTTRAFLGDEAFEALRQDPPPVDHDSCHNPASDRRFGSTPPAHLPIKESFVDTRERVMPYWRSEILPAAAGGQTVLVISSKNTLRSLLTGILDDARTPPEVSAQLTDLDVPNGAPLLYYPATHSFEPLGEEAFDPRLLAALAAASHDSSSSAPQWYDSSSSSGSSRAPAVA